MLDPRKEAQKVLKKYGSVVAPVDVEALAKKMGAQVIFQDSDEDHSGMIYIGANGVVIGVNNSHPSNRKRFTIAHEIGHLALHAHVLEGQAHIDKKFGVQLNRDKRSSLGNDYLEIQANQFAAELLMPSDLLKKEIKGEYFDLDDDERIKELAKKYQVSEQAMSIKLFQTFASDFSLIEKVVE